MNLKESIRSKLFNAVFGKSFSSMVAAFNRGDDASTGGATLSNAYQQSTWIYSCIGAIAKQLAQIPLRVSRGDRTAARSARRRVRGMGEDLVESGPLIELLNRPHPQLTRFDFWYLCVAWLMLRGELFAVPTTDSNEVVALDNPGKGGRLIKRLAILNPENMREIVAANMLQGWQYSGNVRTPLASQALLPGELVYSKLPNPFDFWRGMSPLSVAQLAASTDYASAQFMKGLMMNNADTGVIVTTEQQPSAEQREQILAALRDRKRKAGTADRPLFLSGGAKIDKPSISSADLQFLENRKFNRQEICAIYQTPQEVLGFTEDANRSVSDSARLNFIENTVVGICELFEAAFEPVARSYDRNFYIWFDVDSLPIMQRARQTRFTTASAAMTTMGVPLNVVNGLFDLGLPDDLPHGEKVFLSFSLQEYGSVQPEPTEPAPETETDPADPVSQALKFFGKLGRSQTAATAPHICAPNPAWERSIAGSVKLKEGKLQTFFRAQKTRVLEKLEAELSKGAKEFKALEDLFNLSSENAALLAKLRATIINDLEFGGAQLYQEIGLGDFALKPKDAMAFLDKRAAAISGINATTWDALKDELQTGLSEGESFEQIADRVKTVFTDATEARAGTIALTETTVATNSGRQIGMKSANVERKGWKTAHLESTRQSHWENEILSNEKSGIPIDELWPNGCAYPGDPEGEPGETINCKCFGFAVMTTGETSYTSLIPKTFLGFETWFAGKAYGKSGGQKT